MQEQPVLLEEDGFEDEILVEEETTVVNAMWGDIGGNIENQTDLQNALDAKQDSLTEAQLNAVNSGITSEKVTTYDGYADQIASKADQSALNTEAATREQADTALGTRIDDEATARQNADNGLQSQIDAITSQSDVVDVVANYAALQAYDTSSLSDNDVIKVLDDETHEDALTYYRWSTATQTWSYIGQEAPYYSKGQMDVMLQGKQDTLTAGANIQIQDGTISATDTTYTAGNGLNLNGTEFSADTDILATKEDLESYYTKPETDNLLAPKLEAEVVAELPTTGEEGKLYLTPKAHTTQTATGNPITATVAEDAGAIESFQLDGDTFQQSYEGKNLFNGDTVNAWLRPDGSAQSSQADRTSADYITVQPNATYTLHGNLSTYLKFTQFDSSRTAISQQTTTSATSLTVTTEATTAFVRIGWGNATNASDVMLEAGSTATAYEPYVGGVPSPNPDYPQTIQTVTGLQTVEIQGKNLLDYSAASSTINGVTFTVNDDKSITANGTATARTTKYLGSVPIEGAGTYSQSSGLDGLAGTRFGIQVGETYYNTNTSRTITLAEGERMTSAYFQIDAGMTVNNLVLKPMIELGSTPTTYAPYSKQTLPLDLGSIELRKLGTYQDYIYPDGDDWKVHKAVGKYTFTDASGFTWGSDRNRLYIGQTALAELGVTFVPPASQTSEFYALSEKFKVEAFDTGYASGYTGACFICSSGNTWSFRGGWANETAARSALANTTAYYALATATDTVITDTTLIAQLEAIRTALLQNGANTITNTATGSNLAGDMEIGYYGYNPTNRYDKWLWLDINNEYEQIGS